MLQGIVTLLAMIAFLGVCVWAFSRHKKADFDEAARLPFDNDDDNNNSAKGKKEDRS
ncbi:MAG: cbb3-type cytochrome oxidase subunit 3 [Algiphilus sp.]